MDDTEYGYVKKKINDLLSIDLDNYKEKQMRRRLTSFMERSTSPDVGSYFSVAENDRKMLDELKDFITINVSEFFRDAGQFGKLETDVMPELIKDRIKLKVWSAGCSIGAEPYTLAIMLEELTPGLKHTIVATDLDETILKHAKAGGPYIEQDVRNVKPERLAKYFRKDGEKYWVKDEIRSRIEFKRHNLLKDQYEQKCDLVLCRNVVIYFTDDAKRKINQGFYDSLRPKGVMFIGGSEIIFDAAKLGLEVMYPSFYRKVQEGENPRLMRKNSAAG